MQCFNSTMVRLKDPDAFTKFDLATFQFHYGTIKSKPSRSRFIQGFYFNSTMVRLKVFFSDSVVLPSANFNSTMVRLKVSGSRSRCSLTAISIPLWYD